MPRADFLSFTRQGASWLDFEWLSQVCFAVLHAVGGMTALWLLKIGLLLASWRVVSSALRHLRVSAVQRAAGLVVWAGIILPHSDVRPELFSLLMASLTAAWLERRRLGGAPLGAGGLAWIFSLFAVWSNLHAGLPVGLGLIAVYASAAAASGRWKESADFSKAAVAAAAGGLLNFGGAGIYAVAWRHWREGEALSRHIAEWRPMTAENPLHWPFWAALALLGLALLAAALKARGARRLPWAPVLAAAFSGAAALSHARLSVYFAPLSVLALGSLACEGLLPEARALSRSWIAAFAAAALYLAWAMPHLSWDRIYDERFIPRRAAEFLSQQRDVVEPLRVYNQWQWGGYLAWRLRPWYKVFEDGRYIFHPQLEESARAMASAQAWGEFLKERGLDAALLPNLGTLFETRSGGKTVPRPWHESYMPAARWALVYRDEKALFFVSRSAAPQGWIKARELPPAP